ncbi:MAG: hypothetical protein D6806_02660, partial [Deltaproteobacteria bacterium]
LKVLFVAEKMAALEVVKRRLDAIGLGHFCLELHSHKTKKKLVLDEIARTLELPAPADVGRGEIAAELERLRDRLNRYCRALHEPIGATGVTPFAAFGRFAELEERLKAMELPRVGTEGLADQPAERYAQLSEVAGELQAVLGKIGLPKSHPFWGSRKKAFLPTERIEIGQKAGAARMCAERLAEASGEFLEAMLLEQSACPDVLRSLADLVETIGVAARYRRKWWRIFSGRYRRARKTILEICGEADGRLRRHRNVMLAASVAVLKTAGADAALSDEVHRILEDEESLGRIAALAARVREAIGSFESACRDAFCAVEFDEGIRFGERGAAGIACELLVELFRSWENEPRRLGDMAAFNSVAERAEGLGLEWLVEAAARWKGGAEHLVELLEYSRYRAIVERAHRQHEVLAGFDGATQNHLVEKFCRLDEELLRVTRACIAKEHLGGLPSRNGAGQMAVLRHEFEKKRLHRPIRRLMEDAGLAVQAIKPAFLMSPLSVAAYLPPGSVEFDIVIFDEASQVRPEDAFGAILRAGSAVVVGDSMQLPPTTFFDRMASPEREDDWNEVTSDLESILGLFDAAGAPRCML